METLAPYGPPPCNKGYWQLFQMIEEFIAWGYDAWGYDSKGIQGLVNFASRPASGLETAKYVPKRSKLLNT